jgi:hypothetical protein
MNALSKDQTRKRFAASSRNIRRLRVRIRLLLTFQYGLVRVFRMAPVREYRTQTNGDEIETHIDERMRKERN